MSLLTGNRICPQRAVDKNSVINQLNRYNKYCHAEALAHTIL